MTAPSPSEIEALRSRIHELEAELERLRMERGSSGAAESDRKIDRSAMNVIGAVLEHIPAGAIVAEAPSGEVIFRNELAVEMLGDIEPEPLGRALRGETVEREPMERLDASGRRMVLEVSAAAIFSGTGLIAGAIAVIEDVSAGKRREAVAQQLNENLRQFAHAASHDLQEPLRTISVFSQLLLRKHESTLPADIADSLRLLSESSTRMSLLLRDLLAYCRAVDEHAPERVVDLRAALEEALRNLGPAVSEKGARISSTALPQVVGHPHHFVQVFESLLDNALKFRSQEPVQVSISARAADGGWVVCISDNGIGVPPEYRERIFGVFHRLHGQQIPGTGIGLAICARIVAHYGGRIWAEEPASGQGTAIFFTIPAARAIERASAAHR